MIGCGDIWIDGATLIGLPPLAMAQLEFGAGPIVLYGKNGAGKTWVGKAVMAALAGRRIQDGRVLLHGSMHRTALRNDTHNALEAGMGEALQFANAVGDDLDGLDRPKFDADALAFAQAHVHLRQAHDEAEGWSVVQDQLDRIGVDDRVPIAIVADSRGGMRIYLAARMDFAEDFRSRFVGDVESYMSNTSDRQLMFGDWDIFTESYHRWVEEISLLTDAGSAKDLEVSWPMWACWPVVELGTLSGPIISEVVVNDLDEWPDVDAGMADLIAEKSGRAEIVEIAMGREIELGKEAVEQLGTIERRSNEIADLVLEEAPGSTTDWARRLNGSGVSGLFGKRSAVLARCRWRNFRGLSDDGRRSA